MIYRFGVFTVDSTDRRLTRDGAPVPLADRYVDVLLHLLAHPGEVVGKDGLVQAAWPDVAVTDNSLEQAISVLRKAIAGAAESESASHRIDTVPRRGYRFVGEVTREASKRSDRDLDALLAPHRAWLDGRAALETLSIQNVSTAERAFRAALDASPDHAAAHVGLANALAFRFEATRVDDPPRIDVLTAAVPHARGACRLQPEWAEAWATLGFVLHRLGRVEDGTAAARRAVDLEGDNWRHHLRLAFVCWGEARLRAAQRTLQLMPGLALAHWLAASVHVARQAFAAADRELAAGVIAQDEQSEGASFGGVGLHWLSGLLQLARGESLDAERHFDRELSFERSGHLYARECCAATFYARGAHAWHRGDERSARTAFSEVLQRVPGHLLALAASADQSNTSDFEERLQKAASRGAHADVALARAVHDTVTTQLADPLALRNALQQAPPGAALWYLPVEPILRPSDNGARWGSTLALLRARAA